MSWYQTQLITDVGPHWLFYRFSLSRQCLYPELINLTEHIIYDSCCLAKQEAASNPLFEGIGMCVDPWNFTNKHKNTDTCCCINYNAVDYPKLLTNDSKWHFSTLIAEQINVWLGGYYSICKEMLPLKYDFFLDKMVRLHIIQVEEHLHVTGQYPHNSVI